MSTEAPVAGTSRPLPLVFVVLGGLLLTYGEVVLAPTVPTAAWSGVLDSAGPGAEPGRSFPGSDASRTITLHLRGKGASRTFSIPAAASLSPEELHSGDTVRALVGWGSFRTLPAAILVTSGGTVVIDSAVVLPAQRTQRARVSALGGILLVVGVALLLRHRHSTG